MKNLLTDKTLIAFERYLIESRIMIKSGFTSDTIEFQRIENLFDSLPDSMQYGVLVEFFDSVGIVIQIGKQYSGRCWLYNVGLGNEESDTRTEARTAAITKANELFNQKN